MQLAKHHNIHLVTPLLVSSHTIWYARLIERVAEADGNVHEVFDVDGELVEVESWSADEVTAPDVPSILGRR